MAPSSLPLLATACSRWSGLQLWGRSSPSPRSVWPSTGAWSLRGVGFRT